MLMGPEPHGWKMTHMNNEMYWPYRRFINRNLAGPFSRKKDILKGDHWSVGYGGILTTSAEFRMVFEWVVNGVKP